MKIKYKKLAYERLGLLRDPRIVFFFTIQTSVAVCMYPPPPTVRGVRSPLPLPPRSEVGWVGRSPLAGGAPGNRLFAARGVCDPAIVSDGHNYV